jgi:1,2-phenylacetyl-CoA epoxidase PaaB subunit
MKYEVFARINQGDETKHIGNVTAKSDRLAKMYAYNTFDEEDWDMLAVVREDDYLRVSNDPKPTAGVSASE